MSEQARRSPLHPQHSEAGAHFGAFSGWEMPLRYAGTLIEHAAVRQACGIFDVSHLGVIDVVGATATQVISQTFTNEADALGDGDAQYTLCLSEAGTVLDDLIVYRLDATSYVAIPNAANTTAVYTALATQAAGHEVTVAVREHAVVLAVQGPETLSALTDMFAHLGMDLPDLAACEYMTFMRAPGPDELMLSRTGYTGEYGFELLTDPVLGARLWDAAMAVGVVPAGLAARDTLRLEMGYPLHGHELTNDATPLRRNVGFAIRASDPTFVGAEALQRTPKPERIMRGVVSHGRRPFRDGMDVYVGEHHVGTLTSGGISPTLSVAIGLGMIDDTVAVGDTVSIDVRGSRETATVARPPFVSADPRKLPAALRASS